MNGEREVMVLFVLQHRKVNPQSYCFIMMEKGHTKKELLVPSCGVVSYHYYLGIIMEIGDFVLFITETQFVSNDG